MELDKAFWEEKYFQETTGWDIGGVSPQLVQYFESLTEKDQAILIPGCGNGHEAIWLAKHGFTNVTVIDLAQAPLDHVLKQVPNQVKCIQGDFFELDSQFDLIIEQTFFCALNPNLRKQYVDKMASLLKPNGKLAGLLFSKEFERQGPPFGGYKAEYVELFEQTFKLNKLEEAKLSIAPRLGSELFFEFEI